MTVPETFDDLPRHFRGLDALSGTGERFSEKYDVPRPLVLQYNITGPSGGTWHVRADGTECRVTKGPAATPFMVVCLSAEDWIAVWTNQISVWELLRANRITFTSENDADLDIPYLGLLGPATEPPRDALWLSLHGISPWMRGYFVSGSKPDYGLFHLWEDIGIRLTPNARVLLGVTGVAAIGIWWLRGGQAALVGGLAVAFLLFWFAHSLACRGRRDALVFKWALVTGLVTVRPPSD